MRVCACARVRGGARAQSWKRVHKCVCVHTSVRVHVVRVSVHVHAHPSLAVSFCSCRCLSRWRVSPVRSRVPPPAPPQSGVCGRVLQGTVAESWTRVLPLLLLAAAGACACRHGPAHGRVCGEPFIPPLAWRRRSGGPGLQRPPAVTAWPSTVGAAVTGPHVSLFEPHRPLFSFTCRDLRPSTSLPAGSYVHIALRCRVQAPGPGPARPSLHDALVLLAGGGLCLHALEVLLACSRSWLCRWWPWDLSLRRTL